MPSIRLPSIRVAALRASPRSLPVRATQPVMTQIRCATRDEKWYEPNDGGKKDSPAKAKGTTTGHSLDGTSTASNKKLMMYAAIALTVVGMYSFMMAKPDKVAKAGIAQEEDPLQTKSRGEKQREGGPIRSA